MGLNNTSGILLIGGYPKGYDKPFDEHTVSGRRLKIILDRNNLKPKIMDLWDNQREEESGHVPYTKTNEIGGHIITGWRVIALGHWVHNCLQRHSINVEYLPHPASRKQSDLERLENGLCNK